MLTSNNVNHTNYFDYIRDEVGKMSGRSRKNEVGKMSFVANM